jgi:hypothetical protein
MTQSIQIKNDQPLDVLELEANGYAVVSQAYLRRLEEIREVARLVLENEAAMEELAEVING